MLRAIGFHDQSALEAREVRNERANWVLAAELVTVETAVAQPRP